MFFFGLVLGAWSALVVEAFRQLFRGDRDTSQTTRRVAFCAAAAGLVIALVIFGYAIVARYQGIWDSSVILVLDFVTAHAQLSLLAGFLIGWIVYRGRHAIGAFVQGLFVRLPERDSGGAVGTVPASSERIRPRKWLTKAGGLPIASVLIIAVVLVYLGPDLRSRLQSFKVGELEARFVTATQNSLRITSPGPAGFTPSSMIAEVGSNFRNEFNILGSIQQQIAASANLPEDRRKAARERRERVAEFYGTVVFPLADVVTCYVSQLPPIGTDIQQRAAALARKWRRLSGEVAQLGTDCKAKAVVEKSTEFSDVMTETFGLIKATRDALPEKTKKCDIVPTQTPKETIDRINRCLPELFSNGEVTVFIASLIASTYDYDRAIEYFDNMARFIADDETELTGKMQFYEKRAEVKYYAHRFPRESGRDDLRRGLGIADDILKRIVASGTRAAPGSGEAAAYVAMMRARMINTEMFSLIEGWLEGGRLSQREIDQVERLSKQLQAWLDLQAPRAQVDSPQDSAALGTINLVATAYDTLAMAEMAVGVSKGDRTKDRCARIRGDLATSKDIFEWSSLLQQPAGLSRALYPHSFFRIIEAHYNLYESICGE